MQEKNEKIWILKFAVLVMLVSLVPYVIGFARQGSDWVFTGFVFGVEDGNSYIAKMLSGANGYWLFQTPYTAYPQNGAFAFILYLLLGKLSSSPGQHTQLVLLFHIFRFAAGILMFLATYDFISIFIHNVKLRRLGTALAGLGGGLGFLILFGFRNLWAGGLPLEFYSPETFGFLELFGLPHLALGRALLLWGLCEYLNWGQSGVLSTRRKIIGGTAWLVLGLVQPLTVAVGWMILAAHLTAITITSVFKYEDKMVRWNTLREYFIRALWMGLISSPIVIYTLVAFNIDPFLKEWTSQNIILSPPFIDYLLAYGLLLPFAILGLILIGKSHKPRELLIASWFVIFPLLAYFPYNLQRRLLEGVWVAIIILALLGLEKAFNQKIAQWAYKISCLLFLTTLVVFLGSCAAVWNVHEPIYRPRAEVEAFKYLGEQDMDQKIVLASYSTSNALPAWVPAKVVAGHGPESIHLGEIQSRTEGFFQSAENYQDLLDEFGVDYIFYGPGEQSLGSLNLKEGISVVYHQGDYWIYRVEHVSGKIKQ